MASFRINRGVWLSNNMEYNAIRISGERYYLDYLKKVQRNGGKGKHSSVFVVLDEAERKRRFVIKFCNYSVTKQGDKFVASDTRKQLLVDRFFNEIEALKKVAASKWASKAIKFITAGITKFPNYDKPNQEELVLWVATEEAETDLADYLKVSDVSIDQRVQICFNLLHSLNGLHSIGIIHRDIKPDNVVFVDGAWKFLDLGISNDVDRGIVIDSSDEKIGPFGYMSPEALNKCMGVRNHPGFQASCVIDEFSDVFQLGMMFWFVLRGEVPAGLIEKEDLEDLGLGDEFFEAGICRMLSIRKSRRLKCDQLMDKLTVFFNRYGLAS